MKNHKHVKNVGHNSKFLFGIYRWSWKINLFKKLLKWANKKQKLIFTMLHYFKNGKEKHLEISLFYICVPKILMIWSTVPEI